MTNKLLSLSLFMLCLCAKIVHMLPTEAVCPCNCVPKSNVSGQVFSYSDIEAKTHFTNANDICVGSVFCFCKNEEQSVWVLQCDNNVCITVVQ
mmetsp:Transcript_4381/g.12269  ORF Transcript_4381/g.12269 Transcript_4381/m.12269 type:complete len:93 (-) Transcript_4381:299-577(-)